VNALIEDVSANLIADGVPRERQQMAADRVFWSHFCTNLAPATWVLGALLVGIGLDFRSGVIAILLGNAIGCLPVGMNATLGPRTGLTQIEISRFSFGALGTRVPSALNWFCAVGWDAVNNVPSVLALVALAGLYGIGLPFWLGLSALVAVQLTASMYGHHVVQLLAKYCCYVLIVVFAVTGIVAIAHGGSFPVARAAITPASFVLGVSIIAGFAIGFAPYSSDYTRYLPADTSSRRIFALAFGGLGLSSVLIELCGLLTASHLRDLSASGIIREIASLTGPFAPVALIAIAASAISINSINDNTAAYSFISTGIRIPRHLAAVVTTLCGFALAVAGAGTFAELFSNYLLLLLYWIAPWVGIVLTDWWLFGGESRDVKRWGSGATIFLVVTPLTIVLFSATEIYTGPLARMLGGTDIGFFVGFFVAAATYALVERARRARGVTAAVPGG
jgi:NCS1 family nucleobase:cation symporter-1